MKLDEHQEEDLRGELEKVLKAQSNYSGCIMDYNGCRTEYDRQKMDEANDHLHSLKNQFIHYIKNAL